MNTLLDNTIFDTLVDTNRIYVSVKTKFTLRINKKKPTNCPVYLTVTGNYHRERINLKIYVDKEKWDNDLQRLSKPNTVEADVNLILDNIEAKITNIKTVYRLSEKLLTPTLLKYELQNDMPRANFVIFLKKQIDEDKPTLSKGTWKRYLSVYKKLKAFNEEVLFSNIDYRFFLEYKKFWLRKGNAKTTINSNIKVFKKYLRKALKYGIKIPIDLNEIKPGTTNGNRTSLLPHELKRADAYFFSEFINPKHKLILGYFLFACMTGLRISDIQQLERRQLLDKQFSFISNKSKKDQIISLNEKAKQIIAYCPELFVKKYADAYINRELKKIFKFLKINKKISFHVSRHTFATNFLRMGGQVQRLQLLLGHSEISQTMIYVHIVAEEANKEIFLLDKLF